MKIKSLWKMAALLSIGISPALFAENLSITVNGMVCAFCAQGIEKNFKGEAGVEKVEVDLESKIVKVGTQKNQKLSDEKIKKIIQNSGFNVVKIDRI